MLVYWILFGLIVGATNSIMWHFYGKLSFLFSFVMILDVNINHKNMK